MAKENYKLLFSLSVQLPNKINSTDNDDIDNEPFCSLYNIACKSVDLLCSILLKSVFNTKRTSNNTIARLKKDALNNNHIHIDILFLKPDLLDNSKQEDKIIYDIISSASEILIVEDYARRYDYQHIHHLQHPLTWCAKSNTPYIYVKHDTIFEIANRIEPIVNKLYEFNADTELNITINNKTTAFLPIKRMKSLHAINFSREKHVFDGHVIPGNVKNNENTYLFKIDGQNTPLPIICDDTNNQKRLSRLAKYHDPVRLSVRRAFKLRRGTKEIINRVYLDKILNDGGPGQVPLFQ